MVISIFAQTYFLALKNDFCKITKRSQGTAKCHHSRQNAATKAMSVPINFYHEGALLVQRASLGDFPIPTYQGGVYNPPYPYTAWL